MTNNQLTRERLEKIKSWRETYGAGSNVMLPAEEAEELARIALSAIDSEPVAWLNGCNKSVPAALRYLAENPRPIGGESSFNAAHLCQLAREIELMAEGTLYRHAQPAQTGVDDDVRNIIGLLETNEWAEHCTETVLGSRLEAEITRLVGSAQPAPVVPDNSDPRDAFEDVFPMPKHAQRCGDGYAVTSYGAWTAYEFVKKWEGWNACRAAMLQAQSDDDGEPTDDERIMAIEGMIGCLRCGDNGWVVGEMGITRCACGQDAPVCTCPSGDGSLRWPCPSHPGNSPVIPDTWIPVSEQMPEDARWCAVITEYGYYVQCWSDGQGWLGDDISIPNVDVTHWMPLPAAPQEVKGE